MTSSYTPRPRVFRRALAAPYLGGVVEEGIAARVYVEAHEGGPLREVSAGRPEAREGGSEGGVGAREAVVKGGAETAALLVDVEARGRRGGRERRPGRSVPDVVGAGRPVEAARGGVGGEVERVLGGELRRGGGFGCGTPSTCGEEEEWKEDEAAHWYRVQGVSSSRVLVKPVGGQSVFGREGVVEVGWNKGG
jgi:hypothetical protein